MQITTNIYTISFAVTDLDGSTISTGTKVIKGIDLDQEEAVAKFYGFKKYRGCRVIEITHTTTTKAASRSKWLVDFARYRHDGGIDYGQWKFVMAYTGDQAKSVIQDLYGSVEIYRVVKS